jgi:hypothetical protein
MADTLTRRVAMAVGIVLGALLLGALVFAPGADDSRVVAVGWDEPGLGLLSLTIGLGKWLGKWALLGIGLGVAVKVLRKSPAAAEVVTQPSELRTQRPEVVTQPPPRQPIERRLDIHEGQLQEILGRLEALAPSVPTNAVAPPPKPGRKRATKKGAV